MEKSTDQLEGQVEIAASTKEESEHNSLDGKESAQDQM